MTPAGKRPLRKIPFETRILLTALLAGLPGGLVALLLLWNGDFTPKVQWTLTVFIVCFTWGIAYSLRSRVVMPMQTLSNLVAALREGDYSIRGRAFGLDDVQGEVMLEMNALTQMLRDQRLDALEATTLLRKIMEEIDVAIFAFDQEHRLHLVNRAGERLLARPSERLIDLTAEDLGLGECFEPHPPQILDKTFPGATGRWEARRTSIRQGGLPLELLVLSDVSRALRQEERQAWKRLIRVMSHELNNSLTPIQSIAGSLEALLREDPRRDDWEDDLRRGLDVIASRSRSLVRFLDSYARLARLPAPTLSPLPLGSLVRRVVGLETRVPVTLVPGEDLEILADGDQLEQLLINLIRNAVDAVIMTEGEVKVGWVVNRKYVELRIEDEGPGLSNTANLFVPFFTTKPGGSGIGLVLCRQIAEAHNGTLTIENHPDHAGVEARLRLPLASSSSAPASRR